MATYEELMNSAEQIRTNELPESNTHELVGKHLKNQVEHFNSENQGVKGQITALNKNTGISGYPVWKPNTAYAKGAVILNPDGQLVKNTVEQLDSGGTYNPVLWETTSLDKENREKVSELVESELYIYTNIEVRANNYYNGSNVAVGDIYNESMTYASGFACVKLSVATGEEYELYGYGSEYVRRYIITDSNNVVTRISTDNSRRKIRLVIESGEANLYASFNEYNASVDYIKSATPIAQKVGDLEKNASALLGEMQSQKTRIDTIETSVSNLENNIYPSAELRLNNYYNGGGLSVGSSFNKTYQYYEGSACAKLAVKAGQKYIYKGVGSEYVRAYIITDANNIVTQISPTSVSRSPIEIVIQDGDVNLYVSFDTYDASTDYLRQMLSLLGEMQSQKTRIDTIETSVSNLENNIYPSAELRLNNYYNGGGLSVGSSFNKTYQYYAGSACAKLAVKAGQKYIYKGVGSEYVRAYIITDANNIVTQISPTSVSRSPIEIVIQDGDVNLYVSFDTYDASTDYLRQMLSLSEMIQLAPFKGKNIVCFGDSITEFTLEGKGVPYHLAEMSAANVINVAVGGTRLAQRTYSIPPQPNTEFNAYAAHDLTALVSYIDSEDYSKLEYAAQWLKDNLGDDNTSMVARFKAINWQEVDAITILIGTNDYAAATPIGQADGENKETIKGAINYITATLLTKYPHLSIYWFTPIPRWMASSLADRTDENWAGNKQNSIGSTLIDYCDAILEQCKVQGLPVCDLYRTIGWTKYNLGSYLTPNGTDGVHPYLGFDKIARKMLSFIESNRTFL